MVENLGDAKVRMCAIFDLNLNVLLGGSLAQFVCFLVLTLLVDFEEKEGE